MNFPVSLASVVDILLLNKTCTLVQNLCSIRTGFCVDYAYPGLGSCLYVFRLLVSYIHISEIIVLGLLLSGDLGLDNGRLINVGQINLKKHKACDTCMSLLKIFYE